MDPLNLKKLNEARNARKACVLVSDLVSGRDRLIVEGDAVRGELGEAVAATLQSGKSTLVIVGENEFFLNAHLPSPRLIVIGAVHISQALVPMAKIAGFDMIVIDPRTAFATPERFSDVELYADWPEDVLKHKPLDAYCALAAVTHDPKIDDFPIAEALHAGCFYVGALGSRKTHGKRLERLKAEGVSDEDLARINAPIGLDIGASNPQEIAVAILAQMIAAYRKREIGTS